MNHKGSYKVLFFIFTFSFLKLKCDCIPTIVDRFCIVPPASSINVEGDSIVVIDGKKVVEFNLQTGEKRIVKKFKEKIEGCNFNLVLNNVGSYRIGRSLYYGLGKKIDLDKGEEEEITSFAIIARRWGGYKEIIEKGSRIEGIKEDGSHVVLSEKGGWEWWNPSCPLYNNADLTPNSIYTAEITSQLTIIKTELKTAKSSSFPLPITGEVLHLAVSPDEKYMGIGVENNNMERVYLLNENADVIKEIGYSFSYPYDVKQLFFSEDGKSFFIFINAGGAYSESCTGIKYSIQEGREEIYEYREETSCPQIYASELFLSLPLYVDNRKLIFLGKCSKCCPEEKTLYELKDEKITLLWPFGDFQYGADLWVFIDKEKGEIKAWVFDPYDNELRKENLSKGIVETKISLQDL